MTVTKKKTKNLYNKTIKMRINNPIVAENVIVPFQPKERKASSMISSLMTYYFGKLVLSNGSESKSLKLSSEFNRLSEKGTIYIIDYANVIYILYNKYHDVKLVAKHFVHFIHTKLQAGDKIFIISKMVMIDAKQMDIKTLFNIETPFEETNSKNLYIYNLEYHIKISSSIDDLLGYFICFCIFVYLSNSGIKPESKIVMVTNDSQMFDKNLFGFTDDERKYHIDILEDLKVSELFFDKKKKMYDYRVNMVDNELIKYFLTSHVKTSSQDTTNLECNISLLIDTLLKNEKKNEKKTNNDVIVKTFDYDTLDNLQQSLSKNTLLKMCKTFQSIRTKGSVHLKPYFYLYVYIKYIQQILYNNFYGSMDKERIIQLLL